MTMLAGKHMNYKSIIGKQGEDLACEYLINKGYEIIERNFRQKWGELDIVAKDPIGALVFVEVKTMRQSGNSEELLPEYNLTKSKLIKLQRTAQLFAGKHSELIDDQLGWRIDLIAVEMFHGKHFIRHYDNI